VKRAFFLKSNPDRGGFMRHIYVENVEIGATEDLFYLTSFYHGEGEGHVTEIKDIYFKNITCARTDGHGIVVQGFADKKISDIYFDDIRIDTCSSEIDIHDAERITFGNVLIGSHAGVPTAIK
jgi:hypothetical protein